MKLIWQEYIRSGATYHSIGPVIIGLSQGLKKNFKRGIRYLMSYFEGDVLYWYYDSKDLYETGKIVVKELIENGDKLFSSWDKKTEAILNFIKINTKSKISKMNDKELADIYKKYSELLLDWYGFAISIDTTDEVLMVHGFFRSKSRNLSFWADKSG